MEPLTEPLSLSGCVAVVVMGATGTGKSTFVSLLADQDVEASHGLQSHTIRARRYSFEDPDTRGQVMLMDMPGFDGTSRSDAETLEEISYSLVELQRMNVRLAGLVYLHRISDPRMSASAIKNLGLFKALCGERNYSRVILATTMWTEIEEERAAGQQREQELRSSCWSDLVQRGSKVMQHNGSRESALGIVRALVTSERSRPITLAIQRELVMEGRTLDDTDVGRILSREIDADRARAFRDAQDLDSSLEEAEGEVGRDTAAALGAKRRAVKAKAAGLSRERNASEMGLEQFEEQEGAVKGRKRRKKKKKENKKQRLGGYHTSYDRTVLSWDLNSVTATETDKGQAAGTVQRGGQESVSRNRKESRATSKSSKSVEVVVKYFAGVNVK